MIGFAVRLLLWSGAWTTDLTVPLSRASVLRPSPPQELKPLQRQRSLWFRLP